MTNIPYAENEKKFWLIEENRANLTNKYFKSALRIDIFVQKNWDLIADILKKEGFEQSKDGLREYLEKWIAIMSPEYLMVCKKSQFFKFNNTYQLIYFLFDIKMSPPTDFEYRKNYNNQLKNNNFYFNYI